MSSPYKPSYYALGPGDVWLGVEGMQFAAINGRYRWPHLKDACDYCERIFASSQQIQCEGCGAPRSVKTTKTLHLYSDESDEPVFTAEIPI